MSIGARNSKRSNAAKPEQSKSQEPSALAPRPSKIVIRGLPPTITEEDLMRQLSPIPRYIEFCFRQPDWSIGMNATARAYFLFEKSRAIVNFRNRIDGYVFIDAKGTEYQAIVEYAPNNGHVTKWACTPEIKPPPPPGSIDGVDDDDETAVYVAPGSIDDDEFYLNFLAGKLGDANGRAPQARTEPLNACKEATDGITPLLDYLAAKKERKDRSVMSQRKHLKIKSRQEEKEARFASASKPNSETKKSAGNVDAKAPEEQKMPRSARRAERNQRRRETYLERKRTSLATAGASEAAPQRRKDQPDAHSELAVAAPKQHVSNHAEIAPTKTTKTEQGTASNESKPNEQPATTSQGVTKQSEGRRRIRNKDRPSIAIYEPKKSSNRNAKQE